MSPFDPSPFRALGHTVVDLLADHLRALATPETAPAVLPWVDPESMLERWPADFRGGADPVALVKEVISGSNHLHHPRYVGHQVTSPLPTAALFEFVSAFLNNGSAVYEMGPVSTAMERSVLRFFGQNVGFGDGVDGVLTSGGSVGNLTALLAARHAMAGFDAWSEGAGGGPPLAVLVSDQAHYSVKRAVQIMGWGEKGVALVPTDDRYRLRPDALESTFARAEASGRRVVGVVGSASSTATGSIDPLDAVADFCERRGLWFHVDGAHGASFALSPRLRPRIKGVERASSLVWDAHKMLLTPALLTAVLFRDGRRSYEPFAEEASYLFSGTDPRDQWFDVGLRTLECTKRMMGFVLYGTLATHGHDYFASYLERMVDLAAGFAEEIDASPDFELAVRPDTNIVCFRHLVENASDPDALQARIRRRIVESGSFYLVQTRLRGRTYLRVTIINPRTSESDLSLLLDEVRRAAAA